MFKHLSSLLIGISVIVASVIFSNAYINRNKSSEKISVTGLGTFDFSSDLVVWKGQFTRLEMELSQAYTALNEDQNTISEYLVSQGLGEEEFVFTSVNIDKEYSYTYDNDGNGHRRFEGYRLSQGIEIESTDVDKIEKLARNISAIIKKGVEFSSDHPQYYYTKMSELKIEMIAKATEDATVRAEQIAMHSKAKLGSLKNARMGVFQIIGKNSNEEYSWGGSFNTRSKEKTATITMKLEFSIEK